jgi:hypothetical protein
MKIMGETMGKSEVYRPNTGEVIDRNVGNL